MELIEKEWYIQAPWGRICVVAWGDCLNPPVLVLHGSGDSLASFRPLLRHLPTNFYYVGMEFPGYGRSDRLPPGMVINCMDFVYSVEVVRRHFRWESFVLLAHSLGATIGRLYNIVHPGKIIRAVELDQIALFLTIKLEKLSNWYKYYYAHNYDTYRPNGSAMEEESAFTWDQAIERVIKTRPELNPETARATIERWSEAAGEGLIRFTMDPRWNRTTPPPFTQDQIKVLFTTLPTPTLGVNADKSMRANLYRNTPFLMEDYGNYRVRKVEGGHDVHIAHPERVAPFVNQFLLYGLEGLDNKAKL